MKNVLLILVASVWLTCVCGQAKKAPTKKVDEITILKQKATKWFKEVYVQQSFKDPYSYKLMKCVVSPVFLEEKLEENERDLKYQSLTFKKSDLDTANYFGEYQKTKRDVLKSKSEYEKRLNESDTSGLYNKKRYYDLSVWLHESKIKEFNDKKKLKEKIIDMQKELEDIKSNASPKELKEVVEYKVYIDAYGKNSFGNNVLGKYYYTIDKTGKVISDVGTLD